MHSLKALSLALIVGMASTAHAGPLMRDGGFFLDMGAAVYVNGSGQTVSASPFLIGTIKLTDLSGQLTIKNTSDAYVEVDVGILGVYNGSTPGMILGIATGQVASNWELRYSATTTASAAKDVGFLRAAAGRLCLTNGAGTCSGNIEAAMRSSAGTTLTIAAAATAIAIVRDYHTVDCDGGGNTIATITGAPASQYMTLKLLFVDASCTITDTNDGGANTIDLSAAFISADDALLTLEWNGTSWWESARSAN